MRLTSWIVSSQTGQPALRASAAGPAVAECVCVDLMSDSSVHAALERLLQALQEFEVEQFVFTSTLLVHAPAARGTPIDEDSPLDPKLPYRESKIKTERLIRERHGNIPVVLLRPAGVYDDGGHAAFLAHQIARIFERKLNSRVYPGNLDTGQPLLHLDDLCEALRRIIERRKDLPPELPLLLAEPEAPSFGELQDQIGCALHGERWNTRKITPISTSSR